MKLRPKLFHNTKKKKTALYNAKGYNSQDITVTNIYIFNYISATFVQQKLSRHIKNRQKRTSCRRLAFNFQSVIVQVDKTLRKSLVLHTQQCYLWSILQIYLYTCKMTWTQLFISASFVEAGLSCSSADDWLNKLWYNSSMSCTIKKQKRMRIFTYSWKELQYVCILS